MNSIKDKILSEEELVEKVKWLKKKGKVVVQSHGIFDIIHPGVINHLNLAKERGDVLIVTVIKDKDVKKAPGRPIFPEELRAENIASLLQVDYVSVVSDEIPFECVKRIKPDIFAKGKSYKERDKKIYKKIFKEEKGLYFGQTKIYETEGFSFSSSLIIKDFLNIYPKETKDFLENFSKKYNFHTILNEINSLQKLKVLLIGDGIIDEYHYCESLGKSIKSQIVVNRYLSNEVFAGGVFAIANHIAGLCDKVCLVSLLGNEDKREDFIKDNLKPNVKTMFFYRDDGPTIIKKRYINQYLNQKLFEVNYLSNAHISEDLEKGIIEYLNSEIPKYDVILISDFGHGLITNKILQTIERCGKKFCVNAQTNGANFGYNMITRYHNPFFVCLDEPEVRLSAQERYADIEDVAKDVARVINSEYFIVTRGKLGSLGINKDNTIINTPAFATKVVDIIGAGDAFFAYTAPCIVKGMPFDLVAFIGNGVGALAVQIVGNKKCVEKYEFLEFVHTLLK